MLWVLLSCRSTPVSSAQPLVFTLHTEAELRAVEGELRELGYQSEEPPPVKIVLETSVERAAFGSVRWPHPLQLEIDGGGRTLPYDAQLTVAGSRVTVRNLRHPGGTGHDALLRIGATEQIHLADLHMLDAPADDRPEPGESGAVFPHTGIQLEAYGHQIRVEAERVTMVDAKGSPSVVLKPQSGSFGDVIWREGRFGGCIAPEIDAKAARSFSAPDTVRMGPGELIGEPWPGMALGERWTNLPQDDALLARWREE